MLFSEVYSAYFNTIALMVKEAQEGVLTEKRILAIIVKHAFSESMLSILPAIKSEEWLVINKDFHTPIKRPPQMPLTLLQKRWLKALLSDPRIALFDIDIAGLEAVEPLFSYGDFVFFDRYHDGDPYTQEGYIANFKTILCALQEKRRLHITYHNRRGAQMQGSFIPYRLEYSAKDDKFRLETAGHPYSAYINLARVEVCALLEPYMEGELLPPRRRECALSFVLKDERNALDRVMLHFSDCRKETRRLEHGRYQVDLWYEVQDETELLIRILSFGPMLKVTAPENFIKLIQDRLAMQAALEK